MFSVGIWLFICICLLVIKYGFIKPIEDNKLYKLYEARDNVAIAAVEGKISQDCEEYLFVIDQINFALYYMKNNYDFSIVIKNLLYNPKKIQEYFDRMYGLVEQYDFLQKNYNISSAYFQKSLNIRLFFYIHFIIKPIYHCLRLFALFLKLIKYLSKASSRLVNSVNNRINTLSEIEADYRTYRGRNTVA